MQGDTLAGYKYFLLGEAHSIRARLRATAPGTLCVFLDETCKNEAAALNFSACSEWTDVTAAFESAGGVFPLFFLLKCPGRVDWMEFELS